MSVVKTCRKLLLSGMALTMTAASSHLAIACTRPIYAGPSGTVITTRSNDWTGSQCTNLWLYPRGVSRNGGGAPGAITWVSKYGSVTAAGWDLGTVDGMNEKGLSANALYPAELDYGKPAAGDPRKPLSLTAWAQSRSTTMPRWQRP